MTASLGAADGPSAVRQFRGSRRPTAGRGVERPLPAPGYFRSESEDACPLCSATSVTGQASYNP